MLKLNTSASNIEKKPIDIIIEEGTEIIIITEPPRRRRTELIFMCHAGDPKGVPLELGVLQPSPSLICQL